MLTVVAGALWIVSQQFANTVDHAGVVGTYRPEINTTTLISRREVIHNLQVILVLPTSKPHRQDTLASSSVPHTHIPLQITHHSSDDRRSDLGVSVINQMVRNHTAQRIREAGHFVDVPEEMINCFGCVRGQGIGSSDAVVDGGEGLAELSVWW